MRRDVRSVRVKHTGQRDTGERDRREIQETYRRMLVHCQYSGLCSSTETINHNQPVLWGWGALERGVTSKDKGGEKQTELERVIVCKKERGLRDQQSDVIATLINCSRFYRAEMSLRHNNTQRMCVDTLTNVKHAYALWRRFSTCKTTRLKVKNCIRLTPLVHG